MAKGSFAGTLEPAPGTKLRLVLHLQEAQEGGGLVGSLDSLDQGARGIALSAIDLSADTLRFWVPAVGGSYEGKWDPAGNKWVGNWSQGGAGLPLAWTPLPTSTRPPLAATKNWTMPSPAALAEAAVANRPALALGVGTVDGSRIQTTVRGGAAHSASDATRFEIGSITKVLTDLLLADMVVKGEVRLDQPVRDLLPAGVLSDGGNRPITLRDLATHYSGLPRLPSNLAPTDPSDPYADYGQAKLYAFLKSWSPDRKPGAMFEYSNLGVGLLGHALALKAGKPYEQLLTERILLPLGMKDSDFSDRNLAVPHGPDGKATKAWKLSALAAAGGLRSTTADMTRFAAALLDPPAQLRAAVRMMLDHPLKPTQDFSQIRLGLLTVPTSEGLLLNHDGGTGGMRSSLFLDQPRKRAVVVLSNSVGEPAPTAVALEAIAGVKMPAPPAGSGQR